jgi:hypothetical protein
MRQYAFRAMMGKTATLPGMQASATSCGRLVRAASSEDRMLSDRSLAFQLRWSVRGLRIGARKRLERSLLPHHSSSPLATPPRCSAGPPSELGLEVGAKPQKD